jgi:hypothetical protein
MILHRCQLANLVGAAQRIVVPVMARSADNGGCNMVSTCVSMALAAGADGAQIAPACELDGGKTYGRLHGAHRHRRNRPCTYPNWQRSAHVHLVSMPIALRLWRSRRGYARAWARAMRIAPPHSRDGWSSDSGMRAHPLSMTRAATSSAVGNSGQQSSLR